ncbi:aftiphilin isoform X2 [Hoplias malabaricus]|uniref:aftiphilin isoform X2 n=1 Tax=Hoplias malabaricus TaxID=27720 RepID=UPI003462A812
MEPDVVHLYSSSPPPLQDDEEEEDEDEFGEFGGYRGGVSSSFSFSEYDVPTMFGQSQAASTSPPDLYITTIQNISSSGKTTAFEEVERLTENHQATLASHSTPLVYETNVSVDKIENGEPEASEKVINGLQSSDVQGFNTGQHRLDGMSVPEDCEDSSTGKHGDSTDSAGGGDSLSNGHKFNKVMDQEVPTLTNFNSTETGLASRAESSIGPNNILAASVSQKEISEMEGTVTYEVLTECQAFNSSKACGDHSIKERKKTQGQEVVCGVKGPSDEEPFASFCKVQPQGGIEEFGDCTETLVGHPAETDDVSDVQSTEEVIGHNEATVVPGLLVVVPPGGHSEEVKGTSVDLTVELVHGAELGDILRKDKCSSIGRRIETDEDLSDFRDAVQGFVEFSQTESATQEAFTDFVTALSGCSTDDDFGDTDTLKDLKEEEELPEEEQEANYHTTEGTWCSELPPSDSFADFSSATFGDQANDAGYGWVAFEHQAECEEQHESWAAFDEGQQSNPDTEAPCNSLQIDYVSTGLSCKLEQLFQRTFPSEVSLEVPEVTTLQTLLEPRDNGENNCHHAQGEAVSMWCHLLDPHGAHGLKVQWVGSRSNRILLDCLGIHNILFTGQKKQPVIVPMFAAGLGMLEPTKDPLKPPASSAPLTPSSPGPGRLTLCTQVASSLSSGEDGVDPELYELTTAKLECNKLSSNAVDALNRLMESAEKTNTTARKPVREGEISEEAARVIPLLPDLSFMRARVLMFPHILTPAANQL